MKKFNLFAMSMLAIAAFTFNSCSTDDTMSPTTGQETVDGFYNMTIQVKGSAGDATRTTQSNPENGTVEESAITSGTIYIYQGAVRIFKKNVTASDWKTAPTQTTVGETKPIKVSVSSVKENTPYTVYFLANAELDYPLAANAAFEGSTVGGANYAGNNRFVMFNQNDENKQAAHSTVKFTAANKNEATPAIATKISLDRVVARVDAPTVEVNKIERKAETITKNFEDYLDGVVYDTYALSNLNNNSYVVQNWNTTGKWTLNALIAETAPYYKPTTDYGTKYQAAGLENFTNNNRTPKSYMFENTTTEKDDATSIYFCIKATLTESAKANADFADGTFYRYDGKLYTRIADLMADEEVSNPFRALTAAEVINNIKDANGNLIEEGEKLANFRKTNNIEVYRAGKMYYRYTIEDNYYVREGYYSILRNSIYRMKVNGIYDLGKDVPNGPNPDDIQPNYYMNVTVAINPWVLNSTNIQLK